MDSLPDEKLPCRVSLEEEKVPSIVIEALAASTATPLTVPARAEAETVIEGRSFSFDMTISEADAS